MRTGSLIRAVAFAGLAGASASLAHGDTRDPRWLAVALVGAAVATGMLVATARLAGPRLAGHRALPLGVVTAAMLLAQGAAHAALMLAGAPAHAGVAGGLALHLLLAVLSALLVRGLDHRIVAAAAGGGAAPTRPESTLVPALLGGAPRTAPAGAAWRGRAPPNPT